MSEIKTLTSKVVYSNRWISVREDIIQRPSGAKGLYGVVEKPDFAVILPVQDGYVHLVEQYRYPVKQRFWELPQGAWEGQPEADHAQVARGELQEETGLLAGSMLYMGHQYLAYGLSNQGYHMYFATDFSYTETNLDAEEEGLISKKFSLTEFEQMILSGQIKDATTANVYGLAKLKGLL
ncbi:MAG: NUDIX hydrolase [Paraglaciecola sp.]|nr:NUDIX hydrolase [Paraglaciecola sp.]NCT48899.1 NUDIX hydrolase [Paraglaciecola sp.]